MSTGDPPAADPRQAVEDERSLRHLLAQQNTFINAVELVNSRGVITERAGGRVLELASNLARHPDIHVLSITDNPGGNAVLSAETLGQELQALDQEVIIHLSCKDWNRNGLQSKAWQLASQGFDNVLALSGDYPIDGFQGTSAGVFDIDSVGLLRMLSDMNAGLETVSPRGKKSRMKKTGFVLGAAVNNFKPYEREVMPQYFKLAAKIAAGADFVINQIGYNTRKMDELLRYMKLKQLQAPVLANVYILSGPTSRYFHSGRIPGVILTDEMLALTDKQSASEDKGKAFFLEFAAKQCAVAKGLGFGGAYLGGHVSYDDFARVLEIQHQFGDSDWRDFVGEFTYDAGDEEFYFFEPDSVTGLNSDEINHTYAASKHTRALRSSRRSIPLSYKLNRLVHSLVFEPGAMAHRLGRRLYGAIENRKLKKLGKVMHSLEQVAKVPAFDCRDCGDCSLPDIAYLCPESQCVKNQRNGPCGGTRFGKCEIGEKDCIWARAYDRLKAYGEEETMIERPAVFRNSALKGTSAWGNTFLGHDHHAKPENE
jgi:methylenetetrahydrofolate reductase (NADPH)